ncbi:MAG TPA: hypothetical protein VFG23_16305 [Polyangia bacterium]|nr:hypothetical protein [Polyangia bacterium]
MTSLDLGSLLANARDKNLHRWGPGYARWFARNAVERARAALRPTESVPRHLLFAFCDHFEPLWRTDDRARGAARVRAWREGYPALAAAFRDADGRPPQNSFFFPGEDYAPDYLEPLAELARLGLGEVELHMHHEGETAARLRTKIETYLRLFDDHGHLTRDPDGRLRYAFIHGKWCLANARPDGRWCGVDAELPLLFDTGCYADFTFPSAPDQTQPSIVNQIYWPEGDLARRRAYEQGAAATVGEVRRDRLLMIEGPLALTLERGTGRLPRPRIDSAAVTARDPATPARVRTWVGQGIHVAGQPDWVFVKVHAHGAPELQAASLLGDGGRMLHRELTTRYNDGQRWRLHYVTAREMFNLAIAAMEGARGDPGAFRNHRLPPPPVSGGGSTR